MGHFLEEIGLGHHVASFKDQDISGDMLLEATDETLEELGVQSATEKLKIKVYSFSVVWYCPSQLVASFSGPAHGTQLSIAWAWREPEAN